MRCKKHPTDLTSGIGVCASCLRERLLVIIAAQSCRKIEPPISFPRSVSPYMSRRKSDFSEEAWQFDRRFYSTPHVGATGSIKLQESKRKGGRLSSLFWGLFRSKSEKLDFDSGGRMHSDHCSSTSQSPSWFSSVIPGRRKKQNVMFPAEDGRRRRSRNKGMSPARISEEDDAHCRGGSSGYSSESWRQTPRRTPAVAITRRGGGRSTGSGNYAANLTFCLSPLVRASPNHWPQKGIPPEAAIASGESRVPTSAAAAFFCKNRSRKLADLGRYSSNPTTH